MKTFLVRQHAVDQWRLRAAQYGDASGKEVISVIQESTLVPNNAPLPIRRQRGSHYYYHKETKCYFVTEPVDRNTETVITVIIPGLKMNYLNPKTKNKPTIKPCPLPAIKPNIQVEIPRPEFKNIIEEYQWYKTEYNRVAKLISKVQKYDPNHSLLTKKMSEITKHLNEIKPVYEVYCVKSENENEELKHLKTMVELLSNRLEKQEKVIANLKPVIIVKKTIAWDKILALFFLIFTIVFFLSITH